MIPKSNRYGLMVNNVPTYSWEKKKTHLQVLDSDQVRFTRVGIIHDVTNEKIIINYFFSRDEIKITFLVQARALLCCIDSTLSSRRTKTKQYCLVVMYNNVTSLRFEYAPQCARVLLIKRMTKTNTDRCNRRA